MSLQSMTGYASAQTQLGATAPSQVGLRLGMEIRSVNSRYLDLSFRLPDELRAQEPALRELISGQIKRGKVELRAHLEAAPDAALASPDTAMLQNLVKIQDKVRMWLPHATPLSVAEVMRLASATPHLSEDVTARAWRKICCPAPSNCMSWLILPCPWYPKPLNCKSKSF